MLWTTLVEGRARRVFQSRHLSLFLFLGFVSRFILYYILVIFECVIIIIVKLARGGYSVTAVSSSGGAMNTFDDGF